MLKSLGPLCCCVIALSPPGSAHESESEEHEEGRVVTIDHGVPHISTVSANSGEPVELFLRERLRKHGGERARECDGDPGLREKGPATAVLMIHSRSVPVLAAYELKPGSDYDWALSLARSGLDVFMLDFQGSGLSPRPRMDDPCNVTIALQSSLLIPNPLTHTCSPSYASFLNTSASDLAELDTVVEYIRNLRGVEKVHLVSWSQGSFRIGPYAVLHPEKVASLFFMAPIFNVAFTTTPPPLPTTPMSLTTRAAVENSPPSLSWNDEIKCEGQREPGIVDAVWSTIMENDELGRTWGPPPAGAPAGSPPEGVMRVRQVVLSGWNATAASQIEVPTLIMQGEFDLAQGALQHLHELYSLVRNDNKLRFRVQCTGHFMQWENQRRLLHRVSKQWIKHGKVDGFTRGEFFIDTAGNLSPL